MIDDRPEILTNRETTTKVARVAAEGLVAVAQGGLALVLGVLARTLSGAGDAARNVTAMTPMSWFGHRSMAWLASPRTLALLGLALVVARGGASTWLIGSEVRFAAGAAGAARRRILSAALSGRLAMVSLGAAIAWPQAIELGVRATRARRRAIASLAVLGVVTWAVDPMLAVIILAAILPFALLLHPIRRALRSMHREATRGVVDTVDAVRDVVEHAPVWATCGAERTAMRRVAALTAEGASLSARAAVGQSISSTSNEVMAAIAIVVLVAWFAPGVVAARPTLVPVLVLLVSTYKPLRDLAEAAGATARGEAATNEVASLAANLTERVPVESGSSAAFRSATLVLEGVALDVGGEQVRGGIDLAVHAGETIAIVGAPGTGKSALLEALIGVRNTSAGTIHYDGIALEGAADRKLGPRHRPFAWVSPAPPVLPGTMADNLCPADPDDVHRVARARAILAELGDETLLRLPEDAVLGPRGHRPSSGEAQRLALARALASDAPVLLLDEPTASLDALSEARAVAAIARHCEARLVLLVTHRTAPLAIASRILRLDEATRARPDGSRRITADYGGPFGTS